MESPVRGEIIAVRYHCGVPFVRARLLRWSGLPGDRETPHDVITEWAEPCMPWGTQWYGDWASPRVGEKVWIAFEEGDISRPIYMGFVVSWDRKEPGSSSEWDMPFEFDNEEYLNKYREEEDRELPPKDHPEIKHARLIKTPLGQFLLLHDETEHAVLRGEEKVELGEGAPHNIICGDLFQPRYNQHIHECGNSGPPQSSFHIDETILSQYAYILHNKDQQPVPRILVALGDIASTIASNTPDLDVDMSIEIIEKVGQEAGLSKEDIDKGKKILEESEEMLDNLDVGEIAGDIKDKAFGWLRDGVKNFLGIDIPGDPVRWFRNLAEGWIKDRVSNLVDNIKDRVRGLIAEHAAGFLKNVVGAVLPIDAVMAAVDLGSALLKGDIGAMAQAFTETLVHGALASVPGGNLVAGAAASFVGGMAGKAVGDAVSSATGGMF